MVLKSLCDEKEQWVNFKRFFFMPRPVQGVYLLLVLEFS